MVIDNFLVIQLVVSNYRLLTTCGCIVIIGYWLPVVVEWVDSNYWLFIICGYTVSGQ